MPHFLVASQMILTGGAMVMPLIGASLADLEFVRLVLLFVM